MSLLIGAARLTLLAFALLRCSRVFAHLNAGILACAALFAALTAISTLDGLLPLRPRRVCSRARRHEVRLYRLLDQVCFLAPAERLTRRLLQLILRGGDIPAVGAILSAAVARLTGLLSLARLPPLPLCPLGSSAHCLARRRP